MDEMLKQRIITFLSLYSTNVGDKGTRIEKLDNLLVMPDIQFIEAETLEQVDRIFAHFEEDILDHDVQNGSEYLNPVPDKIVRRNTYHTPAKTPDQYAGNETKPKKDNHNSFIGDDGIERFKTVCKTCQAVSWTKERAYTYCYNHRPSR